MAGQNVLTLTDSTFDADVVKSEVPVLVDFWAAWCGPCRAIAPAVDEIATEYAGRLSVGKVDVDSNGGVAMRYRITSIPTLLLFQGGPRGGHRGRPPRQAGYRQNDRTARAVKNPQALVTAPSDAEATRAQYLANTPLR